MRLIDANSVLQGIEELKTSPFANPLDGGKRHLIKETLDIVACLCVKKEPTVDAVEVVRCKNCKHNYANMIPADPECCLFVELPITDDFYCANGERREDNA